ncbi:MAG: hypothetical protein HYY93_15150 [Planctomycetes bacterium]|nr:hypothetical protein [Planctomycetota bacterium]
MSAVLAGMMFAGAGSASAQTPGTGDIVIIGADLSGHWEFEMAVLVKSDPSIGDLFTGSFDVTGGVPTYSGDGTFNGLPATISGDGAVDSADGTTIILSDHIAATDSRTRFDATLMSGVFGTGTFEGGTLDGQQSWSGVFKITITRPPTQSPAEQIESAFQTAAQNMSDTVATSRDGFDRILSSVQLQLALAFTGPQIRKIAKQADDYLRQVREDGFRQLDRDSAGFRSAARAIIDLAPSDARPELRRLAGERAGELGRTLSISKVSIARDAHGGKMLLQERKKDAVKIKEKEKRELLQLFNVLAFARFGTHGATTNALRAAQDFLQKMMDAFDKAEELPTEDLKVLKVLLGGGKFTNPDEELPGLLKLVDKRAQAEPNNRVDPDGADAKGVARMLFRQFGIPFGDDDINQLARKLAEAFNAKVSRDQAKEKANVLGSLLTRIKEFLGDP